MRSLQKSRTQVITYLAGGVTVIGLVASLAVLDAERDDPLANIATFGDALWWTATTHDSRIRRPLSRHSHGQSGRRRPHDQRNRPTRDGNGNPGGLVQ